MKDQQDRKKPLAVWKGVKLPKFLAYALCVVFVLLIAYLVQISSALRAKNSADPNVHFKGCQMLAENCLDMAQCPYNVYCGDGLFKDCRVYDCGDNFSIYTKNLSDQIEFKTFAKPSEKSTTAIREACSGSMQILSQECKDNKTKIKVKLNTKGKCEIESFATIYENIGAQPNTFTAEGDNTYTLTAYACGKITQIIPAAQGGIGLDLTQSEN